MVAAAATVPVLPAVPRLSQITMLKLDSVQAACFGAGILLCLAFQVAIVVVLLRQRQLQPMPVAQFLPAEGQSVHFGNRTTAIADLEADGSLWENTAASLGRKWQMEDENLRKQEAAIVEELVSKNVMWARELAQS